MAKIVKRRKRKFNLKNFAVLFLMFAAMCSLTSSLFLRSYNNSLSVQTQRIEEKIVALKSENEAIQTQIQTLSSRDRVTAIAEDAGMEMNQDNVVTVANAGE